MLMVVSRPFDEGRDRRGEGLWGVGRGRDEGGKIRADLGGAQTSSGREAIPEEESHSFGQLGGGNKAAGWCGDAAPLLNRRRGVMSWA